jgi:sugar phosphate isomerase/epimerase
MKSQTLSRRNLMASAALAAAGLSVGRLPSLASAAQAEAEPAIVDHWHGLKIGVASYTFRNFKVEETIKGIHRVGLNYVSIKDFHLPMKSTAEQRKAVVQQFKDAGITPDSCGVVYMTNKEDNIRLAFDYAKDGGFGTIVCSPDPESMPILDKMVKEYDIKLAIHNHGPGDKKYPLPEDVMRIVADYDKRIGLCIDIGHVKRMGQEPAASILKCRERLYDMHLKDVSQADAKGVCVEAGRGVIDLKAVVKAMLEIKYPYVASFEYEKDAKDPVPGLAESVGYFKGLVEALA